MGIKPWDNQKLVETLLNAAQAIHNKNNGKNASPVTSAMYWGESPIMQQLRSLVEKVAITNANILITGENGTGKEMLAREIHALSSRRTKEMIAVDMGAITESLFESELFGHTKGSFTDAYADRPGKFETADHSTLFLDEIGNLPYHLQAKLLTVLQRRSIVRVGSNQPIAVDIRLICATNRNLNEMVQRNEFREDLLYRINTIHLEIPPLRERPEDILPLAERFITRFCTLMHLLKNGNPVIRRNFLFAAFVIFHIRTQEGLKTSVHGKHRSCFFFKCSKILCISIHFQFLCSFGQTGGTDQQCGTF